MTTIYYWQGAAGDHSLLETHQAAISNLLSGDYAATDLEKLHSHLSSHHIYSFRLNSKARLLFTTYTSEKKSYLLVLEYLPEHDYQKSRFLQKGVLSRYLNKINSPATEHDSRHLTFQPIESKRGYPTFEATEIEGARIQSLDYFNQQFIQISSTQNEVLCKSLPVMIMGAAGSGKSYVALSLLRQFIEQHPSSDEPRRILYVTKSIDLMTEMKTIWNEFYNASCETPSSSVNVDFMTYHQVLNHVLEQPITDDKTNLFYTWFNGLPKSPWGSEILFQEFRICSAYTQEKYCKLGKHQSVLNGDERRQLYTCYTRYLAYLQEHSRIDPVIHSLSSDVSAVFDRIVVDEAQILSLVQQQNLCRLAKNAAIAYCFDPHQNTIDQFATRPLLAQWYWRMRGVKLPMMFLQETYRCSYAVAETINAWLQAQHHLMGKIDKAEVSSINVDPTRATRGEVWLTRSSPKDNDKYAHILERATTVHFAVITHEELIEEARAQFNTPLVFTVNQIQGLEYHTIVIYKLFSDDYSKQLLKNIYLDIERMDRSTSNSVYRAKGENPHQHHAPWFNRVYTAYSRAQHTLLIFESNCSDSRANALLNWMDSRIALLRTIVDPKNETVV